MSTAALLPVANSFPSTFNLTLGAGGARGLAHIIILETLDELGIRPSAISGASIGSIMGACYASGMTGTDVRSFFLELASKRGALVSALTAARVGRFRDIKSLGNPFLFDGEKLLNTFWPSTVPKTFEELKIPLKIIAADFYGAKACTLLSGSLLPSVAASIAIPGVFQTVSMDNTFFTDGGILNPLPFDVFDDKAPIIAVDVTGAPLATGTKHPTGFQILSGSIQLLQSAIVQEKLKQRQPDILMFPPISQFSILDFLKIEQILKTCEPIKDELKRKIEVLFDQNRMHF